MIRKGFREESIDLEFTDILNLIEGGYLYGEKIDIKNIKEMVISAYYAGKITQI